MTLDTRGARRTTRPSAPRILALALAAGAALALSGCGAASGGSGSGSDALRVVATTTQLTDFSATVGGDDIELTGLLPAGGSAHHFDPSPADLLALGQADVLVVNGAGLETFVDDAIDASGFDGEIVTASDGIDLAEAKEITAEGEAAGGAHDHDHAEEGHADEHGAEEHAADEHAADEHAAEEHGAEEHGESGEAHDHDHGDINPHLWTSPKNAEGMVAEIARGFERADPDHADDYSARAEAYTAKLSELDEWIAAQFERVPAADRVLVSGHDSLRYYLHDYGIAFAGALLPSFEDNAEPSAADIDELVEEIRDSGVKAVFVESSMSPKLARTVADEAGVEVVDAESLYADSLGAPDSGADTYFDATVHNTRVILEAWGVDPEPLPASLQQ